MVHQMHAASVYADLDRVDDRTVKDMLLGAALNGGKRMISLVAEDKDGVITGFIIGALDAVYGIGRKKYATDLLFYVEPTAGPGVALKLLRTFCGWAEGKENVVEIRMGVTDAMSDAPERAGPLYRRVGLKPAGVMFAKRIDRSTQGEGP